MALRTWKIPPVRRSDWVNIKRRSSLGTPNKWPWIPTTPYTDFPKDLPWIAVANEMKSCKTYQMQISVSDWSDPHIDKKNFSSFLNLDDRIRDLIKRCQQDVYGEEIQRLEKGKSLRNSSHILSLHPILGEDGLLRLGGWIRRAKIALRRPSPSSVTRSSSAHGKNHPHLPRRNSSC